MTLVTSLLEGASTDFSDTQLLLNYSDFILSANLVNAPLTYTHSSGSDSSENTDYYAMFVKMIMCFAREAIFPYFLSTCYLMKKLVRTKILLDETTSICNFPLSREKETSTM